MKYHTNYDLVEEALANDATRECILAIQSEKWALLIIGVDEEVLHAAASSTGGPIETSPAHSPPTHPM